MGSPSVLWDEAAALDQLRAFLVAACAAECPAGNIYRGRPAATPAVFGRPSVVIQPLTTLPTYQTPAGFESTAKQAQVWQVAIITAAAGNWTATVLGQTSAPYVADGGDTTATIAAGLRTNVDALALAVTTAAIVNPPPQGFTVTADVAGVSLGVTVSAPVGGAYALTVVDDNLRRAVWNFGIWRVRLLFRDVPSAERTPVSGVRYLSAIMAEKVRLMLQASSQPVTNGSAYPYFRDNLQATPARLSWYQTSNPIALDVQEDGAWVRVVALDVDFQVPVALTHDVPSLDAVGLATSPVPIADE